MTKRVTLALALVSCGALNAHVENSVTVNLVQKVQLPEERIDALLPEKVVIPQLSPENVALIKEIAQKLCISEYSLDSWASHEDWLNTLSQSERTYVIGSHLLMGEKFHKILYGDVLVVLTHHALGIGGLLLGRAAYPDDSIYTISQDKRAAIALSTLFSIGAICFITHKCVIEPLVGKYIQRLIVQIDAQTVRELGCKEGAISALAKMGITTYPLSEYTDRWCDAINFNSKYIKFDATSFTKRIENLKQL